MEKNTVYMDLEQYDSLVNRLNDISVIAVKRLEQIAKVNEICYRELEKESPRFTCWVDVDEILRAIGKDPGKAREFIQQKKANEAADEEEEDIEF